MRQNQKPTAGEGRRQKLKAKSKGKDRKQRSKAEGIQGIAKVEGKAEG
jgi:hypothetical protein